MAKCITAYRARTGAIWFGIGNTETPIANSKSVHTYVADFNNSPNAYMLDEHGIMLRGVTGNITTIPNINMWLFRANGPNTPKDVDNGVRIYSMFASKNRTPVIDLKPYIDHAGRPRMYDLVSKQPFYNEGTGEFLYG